MRPVGAFTLAELLISLAILGVIAVFTIPKILQTQQDSKLRATAKEVASMLSGAHSAHRHAGTLNASTRAMDLTPYMNYVRVATDSDPSCGYDSYAGDPSTYPCDDAGAGHTTLRLHNGALLMTDHPSFGGTGATNAIWFYLDADGKPTGKGDSLWFVLYYNGRITTWGDCTPGTQDSSQVWPCPDPAQDPPWFAWD